MGFGTGLGIALGAGADAYRKQTAFDTDQQYQNMLIANQKNEIDSRNKVQQQIQSLAPPGVTQYQSGTDAGGNPIWSTQAPAAANANGSSPAPPASIAAASAPAQALPTGASANAPPPSIAAPAPAPSPQAAIATQQAGAMPAVAQDSSAASLWSIPGATPAVPTAASAGALPQSSTPDQSQATPQPAVPSRVYSAQQRMLDIADIYMKSGVPSLISAAGEIQNNALNTQLTQQRIAAGDRAAADAQLDDTLKKASVLLAGGDTDAALNTAFSAVPGHTGLSVHAVPADGPVGTEGQVVAQVYGPDHQLRYSLPAATPQNYIDKMRYGLLDPEAQSKVQLQISQGHAAEATAKNLDADASKTNAYLAAGGTQADLDNVRSRTAEAYSQGAYLSQESNRLSMLNLAAKDYADPSKTPEEKLTALHHIQMASGVFPQATVAVDPSTGQIRQTRNDVDPANQVTVFSPDLGTYVNPGTVAFAQKISTLPEWQNREVTLQRNPTTNEQAWKVEGNGHAYSTFAEAQSDNKGYQETHRKVAKPAQVRGRTGDALPPKSALPTRGNASAADVGDMIHSGVNSFMDALAGPQSSALGMAARFGAQ